ncbi:acetyl-CoA carboxylase biotin carboxylase subunit [Hydromonas duriensis]|uniref:biotin carboxylase n=1 Tax=Hydromonas duriensis TaxID=1527608 RepID=A0A4R6Y8X7_9BURK|nr:acetyl-CoA carboxylase biotin carboxylase subunit [Hydromonas duriensis]TDR31851.1 biotin carboxylase [Hydromonas duriensis]
MREIKKLLICARGEIALRILRSAKEMGMTCVVAHSSADETSLPVKWADEAVNLGAPHAKKSYLNQDLIIQAALDAGADAIHPGYGFLSENADFARKVVEANLIFVGPQHELIAQMGNKAQAIETAKKAGVPVVPGSDGLVQTIEAALAAANDVGYPILIKAAAGGGGRGIRVAYNADELQAQIPQSQQEALAAFGDAGVYLERYIARARHIEVQILGDGDNAVHLFERDCSLQRRRQKIWEEAPAQILSEETRQKLLESAVKLAKKVKYKSAGTLEYLYDVDTQEFFFIEMNTRIQVEHTITEEICGVDLIKAMLLIAQGHALPYQQNDIQMRGHAIEIRINAENPDNNFMPSPGTLTEVVWPLGAGVRIDSMAYSGYTIPPYYDSLIGKLIIWAEDRPSALARLHRALDEIKVAGVHTTLPFFKSLLSVNDVQKNDFHTVWVEQWMNHCSSASQKEAS